MKNLSKLTFTIAVLIIASCGDQADPLGDAWLAFSEGSYESAHDQFKSIGGADGNTGLGWTTLKMGEDSFAASNRYFLLASTANAVECHAGWTFAAWAVGNYTQSVSSGDLVLAAQPQFVFEFDQTIVRNSILLTQAYSYFHLINNASCLTKIQAIDNTFTPNLADPAIRTILLNKLDQLNLAQ